MRWMTPRSKNCRTGFGSIRSRASPQAKDHAANASRRHLPDDVGNAASATAPVEATSATAPVEATSATASVEATSATASVEATSPTAAVGAGSATASVEAP
jgi:hypothetical protein